MQQFAYYLLSGLLVSQVAHAADAVSFARDIRPLLAKHCFACHGPDESARQAGLRLDTFSGATADLGGYQAIQPGDSASSELLKRITSDDPDEVMPPRDSAHPLAPSQIEKLRLWIDSGGKYQQHWSFVQPKAIIPPFSTNPRVTGPIDAFVSEQQATRNLTFSSQADRYSLIRRMALDLTGLPPTTDDIQRYLQDPRPNADGRMIDRLLASPGYGERWTRNWLDLARYSDTNGYEKDRPRTIWPYRDWVLGAINDDIPFDQFSVAQLAGDLLPNATEADQIATGFHRNTMLNEEGGIDPLEYRFYAMVDRVLTTGTIWTGLTIGCAQCHTHKFDPITHDDYYRTMAMLNNADEPELRISDAAISSIRNKIDAEILQLESRLASQFPPAFGDGAQEERVTQGMNDAFETWIFNQHQRVVHWHSIRPSNMSTNLPKLELLPDDSIYSTGDITKRDEFHLDFDLDQIHLGTKITGMRIEALPDDRLPASGPGRCYYEGRRGDFFLSEINAKHGDQSIRFADGSVDYGKLSIGGGASQGASVYDNDGSTGWSTSGREGHRGQLVMTFAEPLEPSGRFTIDMLFERHFAASLGRFRVSVTTAATKLLAVDLPQEVESILLIPRRNWTAEQTEMVRPHFLRVAPELTEARRPIDQLRSSLPEYPSTLVMKARPADNPRLTHVHHRGEYLSPRDEVSGSLPNIFLATSNHIVNDRLSLARWLVSESNPLAGRVLVNRAWQSLFGTGIVASPGDLGTQSPPPTHPELLDWLGSDTLHNGWSIKRLHREIVQSTTYRQDSTLNAAQLRDDPTNMYLARGPRLRLEAEMVRDQAIEASGLLSRRWGGPSVKPPQPASVTELAYGNESWNASSGTDRYRRSLYTFSKRTAPFAAFQTFDAPSGENCTVRRDRSNTPLQSLILLNDEMYLEAARELGKRTVTQADEPSRRAQWLWQSVLVRPATEGEVAAICNFVVEQMGRLERNELSAADICGNKQSNNVLQAAWVLAARVVLNLDETVTKP